MLTAMQRSCLYTCCIILNAVSIQKSRADDWQYFTGTAQIICIAEDNQYLWFGTEGGLLQRDKTTNLVVHFNRWNSPLPQNKINSIVVNKSGVTFLLTANQLVSLSGGHWTTIPSPFDGKMFAQDPVMALDQLGNCWIGAENSVYQWDGHNWTTFNPSNSGMPNWTITSMVIDRTNRIWFGANEGLIGFDMQNWTTNTLAKSIKHVAVDSANNIWIARSGYISKFDGVYYRQYVAPANSSTFFNPSALTVSPEGLLWIGAGPNLLRYDGANWQTKNSVNSSLTGARIEAIHCDRSGQVWVGTQQGLSLIATSPSAWKVYTTKNSGMIANKIKSIYKDRDGNMWFGSTFGNVMRYNGSTWKF